MIKATITLDSAVREAIAAHQKAWTAIQELGDDVDDKTLGSTSRIESEPDSKGQSLANRLTANRIAARVMKAARVSARFS